MNNNRTTYYVVGIIIVVLLVWFFVSSKQTGVEVDEITDKSDLIRVTAPLSGALITSPLMIRGEARGTWYFEASFPVRLLDGDGKEVAIIPAQAKGEWMTEEFVPFEVELAFTAPSTDEGTLVFQKDNPSGLPEHDDEFRMPVKFRKTDAMMEKKEEGAMAEDAGRDSMMKKDEGMMSETIPVRAFFSNSKLDPEVACTKVFPVVRMIPKTTAVGRAAITELLKGVTLVESSGGFSTNINTGVTLQNLTIENGTAKADFNARLDEGVAGACRAEAIRAQITETLKQFSTVSSVVISANGRIEDILQP